MSKLDVNTITVNGVEYVRRGAEAPPLPTGNRAVVVVDRGWIFAGDVDDSVNGRIRITRAVHVRSWSEIGFDGLIANPKSKNVVLKPLPQGVDLPADAELFRVPVPDGWGL